MIPAAVRIFVCTESIDMRQGFDRLAQIVKAKLNEDPQAGSLFVFANRNATRLKALWFDSNGWRARPGAGALQKQPFLGARGPG